jgi:hypothetical protein
LYRLSAAADFVARASHEGRRQSWQVPSPSTSPPRRFRPDALVTPYTGLGIGIAINVVDDDKGFDAAGEDDDVAIDNIGGGTVSGGVSLRL